MVLQYHPEIRNATLASAQLNLTLRPIDAPELRQLTTGTCVIPAGLAVQSAFHLNGVLTADNPVLGAVDYSTNNSYFDGLRVHICIDGAWSDVDAVATADGRSDLTTVQTGARVSFPLVHLTPVAVFAPEGAALHCNPGWYGRDCSHTSRWRTDASAFMVLVIGNAVLVWVATFLAFLQSFCTDTRSHKGRVSIILFAVAALLLGIAGLYSDSPGPDALLDGHADRQAYTAMVPLVLCFGCSVAIIYACTRARGGDEGQAAGVESANLVVRGAPRSDDTAGLRYSRSVAKDAWVRTLIYAIFPLAYLLQLSGRRWYGWAVFGAMWVPFLVEGALLYRAVEWPRWWVAQLAWVSVTVLLATLVMTMHAESA